MNKKIDVSRDREFVSFGDCVIRSRVSLFRSMSDFSFPLKMSTADSQRFMTRVKERLSRLSESQQSLFRAEKINGADFDYYRDRGILSEEYSRLALTAFFYLYNNATALLLLGREQIELRSVVPEFELFHAAEAVIECDRLLETVFPYAVSLRHGYLNSRLDLTGAGIEAEVLLSLPALNQTDEGDRLLKIALSENLKIEPYRCPALKENIPGVLTVTAVALDSESEEEMLSRFAKNLSTIIKMERLKRREWKPEQIDQISARYREALERIHSSVKMTLLESYQLLDIIRTAILAGVADFSCSTLNRLFDFLKESSLTRFRRQFSKSDEPVLCDHLRAGVLKDIFCGKAEVLCLKD